MSAYADDGSLNVSVVDGTAWTGSQANAIVKSYDSDGFTLTWGKVGSPTGTGNYYALCLE